jgi:site-specific DNA-methyltransferase (adenine-specific)
MDKIQIGDCTLYHGDSLEILPTLPPVDLVLTDPPYLLTSGGCTSGGLHQRFGGFKDQPYGNSGEIVPCDIDWPDFMPLLYGALMPGKQAYVMCNNRHVKNMLNSAESAGFEFHNLLVWDKISATPNRWYMKNCEFIGFFYKTPAKAINDCSAKQLIKVQQKDETKHATEKPVSLMQHYIEQSSAPGETVIDPFSGSFSTAIACMRSKRKFIGIEKEKRFFDIGVERIKKEINAAQALMF